MAPLEEPFAEAARNWDLKRLYQALAVAKRQIAPRSRRGLTETEKLYLRGLLCGCSPAEIARQLHRSRKGVEVYVCKTLYQYLKNLADVPNEKLENWRNIGNLLETAGYKTNESVVSKFSIFLPIEALIKIVDMGFENQNTLRIDINIKLSFPSGSENQGTENLDTGDGVGD